MRDRSRLLLVSTLAAVMLSAMAAPAFASPPLELQGLQSSPRLVWKHPIRQGNAINTLDYVDALYGWYGGDRGTIVRAEGTLYTSPGCIAPADASYPFDIVDVCFPDATTGWAVGGNHIMRTTDAGATWTQQKICYDLLGSPIYPQSISMAPDLLHGWAVGGHAIYYTSDGGANWSEPQTLPGNGDYVCWSVATPDGVHAFVRATAGLGQDKGYLYTADAGATWEIQDLGTGYEETELDDFVLSSAGTAAYAVAEGKVFRTMGGAWTVQKFDPNGTMTKVAAVGSGHAWAWTDAGKMHYTANGGLTTWTAEPVTAPFSEKPQDVEFVSSSNGFAIWRSRPYYTTDGGSNWYQAWDNYSGVDFLDTVREIDMIDDDRGCLVSGQNICTTTNGGTNWRQTSTSVQLSDVTFLDGSYGWACGADGAGANPTVFWTTDGGDSWGTASWVTEDGSRISFCTTTYGWMIGDSVGELFKSTNAGSTWTPVDRGHTQWSDLDTWGTDVWIAGDDGQVIKTTGDGSSFTTATAGSDPLTAIDFVDGLRGWVTTEFGDVYRTVDGGTTWTECSGYPYAGVSLDAVSFSDENHGWVAGRYSIGPLAQLRGGFFMRTRDGGVTWEYDNGPLADGDTGTKTPIYCIDSTGAGKAFMGGGGGAVLKAKPEPAFDPVVVPSGPVAYEAPVVLDMEISGPSGPLAGLGGVTVQYSIDGGTTWQGATPAVWNGSEAQYQATVAPRQNAKYRFAFAGDPAYSPAESAPSATLPCMAYLGKPAAPTYVYRNKYFTIYGSVKPRHAGKVPLYMYRYYSGKWHYHKAISAPYVTYASTTTSKYSIKTRVPYKGRYKVRADHKDSSHAYTKSAYEYFTCR